MAADMAFAAAYQPRDPEASPLYRVVAGHLETFLARQHQRERYVPAFVEGKFEPLPGPNFAITRVEAGTRPAPGRLL